MVRLEVLTIFYICSEPNSDKRLVGKLFLFSGKSGHVLKWQNVPDKRETYFSPVVYSTSNGTDIALFGTGGETHSGSLWAIDVVQLYRGHIHRAVIVYSDKYKGMLATMMSTNSTVRCRGLCPNYLAKDLKQLKQLTFRAQFFRQDVNSELEQAMLLLTRTSPENGSKSFKNAMF